MHIGSRPKILLVEDEALIRLDTEGTLASAGYDVISAADAAAAAAVLKATTIDGAVIDFTVVGGTTLELARTLTHLRIPFIFFTGADRDMVAPFQHVPVVEKPYRDETLLAAVAACLQPRRQQDLAINIEDGARDVGDQQR